MEFWHFETLLYIVYNSSFQLFYKAYANGNRAIL